MAATACVEWHQLLPHFYLDAGKFLLVKDLVEAVVATKRDVPTVGARRSCAKILTRADDARQFQAILLLLSLKILPRCIRHGGK